MSDDVAVDVELAGGGVAALASLLASCPEAMVAAIGGEGRLVPVPPSLPVGEHARFERGSGIDLVVPEDRIVILEAWRQAQVEPVVSIEVRLLIQPDRVAALHLVDVRSECGVHAVVIEADDPAAMLASVEASDARRRGVGHVKRDATGVFLEVDAAATTLLGWMADELVGHSTIEFVHPDDLDRAVESWMAMRSEGGGRTKLRLRHATGRYVWLEVSNDNRLDDPQFGCVLSEMVDISEEMAELEALQQRERLLERLAEALPIGICHLRSDRQVLYANTPLIELLGPIDSIEGLTRSVAAADRQRVSLAIEGAFDGRTAALEVGVTRGREERRCDLTIRAMRGDIGGIDGVIVCTADVTDRSRLRSELEHRASHDALSGCLNRAATVTALERALRDFQQVAVAYIDIDHFKAVNDDHGHAAGDEVLRVVAARLRSVMRAEDHLGRMGGDEFVVICPYDQVAIDAAALVERLREAVSGDVTIARQRIPLQASVGAAASVDGERDAEAVLGRADAAMYEAKRRAHRDPEAPVLEELSPLDRFLPVWIGAAMALGLGLGRLFPGLDDTLDRVKIDTVSLPIALGLLLMMYPVLAKVRYSHLGAVTADRRMLGLSLVLNWLIGPALMFGLAWLFLPDLPEYRTGLIIVGLARCIAMVLIWNDLAGGNREAATFLVAVNSLFQIGAYSLLGYFYLELLPSWLGFDQQALDVSIWEIARAVLIFLGVPLLAGYLTRRVGEGRKGTAWYEQRFLPRIGPVALYGLLFTIVVLFALQGDAITSAPFDVARIALPLLVYFALMWTSSFAIGLRMGLPYDRNTTVAFTAAGNNFELGIAVAIGVFGVTSGQALAGVVGPLIEVPALVGLVYVALWARRRFYPTTARSVMVSGRGDTPRDP